MSDMNFTQRFDISIDLDEAKRRFINRSHTLIFSGYYYKHSTSEKSQIKLEVALALGERFSDDEPLSEQIGYDFNKVLLSLETFYRVMYPLYHEHVDSLIKRILEESENDIGIKWDNGRFVKSGAKLLDDILVNENLHWLRDNKFSTVLTPFEKGLDHYMHSENRPELLSDVITDMYEAVEALAKIITDRPNKDLSANKELFLSKISASDEYKGIMSEYITYANNFRHASNQEKSKPNISYKEIESFIYLTGIFLRLATL